MAPKPISSLLEKIRKRKAELSKKATIHERIQHSDFFKEMSREDDPKEDAFVSEALKCSPEKAALLKPIAEPAVVDLDSNGSLATPSNEDEHRLTLTSTETDFAEKPTPSFRAPLNDTQDLFSDSQTNDESDPSNEKSGSPGEEFSASTLPSLNLKFDSALPDDISCSDKEESDDDINEPHPLGLLKRTYSPRGDPVKKFLDEEALEDDSDNDLQQFYDEDECENAADAEEVCAYIDADFKEKPVDQDTRNELHQMWLQQQDEAGTENLLQKLKHGTDNQRVLSVLSDNDDESEKDELGGSDDNGDEGDLSPKTRPRLSTKKLKQMISQMFTDKDDGYVSSEDEETKKKLDKLHIRQKMIQKKELERQRQLLESDETSSEAFSRIKKLNTAPDPKKIAKTSYLFDSLLNKGGDNSSSKSSFLQKASSHPVAQSSHKSGPRTGKSFIFGRDDSNSRNSLLLSEDSSDLVIQGEKETSVKKPSAKFTSSQAKRSNGGTDNKGEGVSSRTSLFEILKRSSSDVQDKTVVDHQAVFAAFASVKKRVKIEGRPY